MGDRLRRHRAGAGAGEAAQGARRAAPRAVRRSPGDRRRDRLLHAQPAAAGSDRPRHRDRHLAGDAGLARGERLRPRPRGLDRGTDAERLPFADGSFDLVFGHAVLHHIPDLERAFSELHRVLRPGGAIAFCGEPSRHGDRLAALPKRTGQLLAPAWRAAVGADPAPATGPAETTATRWRARSTSTPSPPPSCARSWRGPGSRRSASAARSCSPTSGAGACARSRPAPTPTRCRSPGAALLSAAISRFSASTSPCWSRACPPSSSTTWSSRPARPPDRPGSAEGEGVARDAGLEAQGEPVVARPAAGRPGCRGAGRLPRARRRGRLPRRADPEAAGRREDPGASRLPRGPEHEEDPAGAGSRGRARSPLPRWRPRAPASSGRRRRAGRAPAAPGARSVGSRAQGLDEAVGPGQAEVALRGQHRPGGHLGAHPRLAAEVAVDPRSASRERIARSVTP